MTDAAESANGQPTAEQAALAAEASLASEGSPAAAASPVAAAPTLPAAPPVLAAGPDERPEIAVGAAFAGGLALALLLKRLAR